MTLLSLVARPLISVPLAILLSGCSMSRTTTNVRSTPLEPRYQIRLVRLEQPPLVGAWEQQGRSLLGHITYTASCQAETRHVVEREQIAETGPNKAYYVGAYVAGALLTVAGIALAANSAGKSNAVTCGSGGRLRAGDSCESEASAWRTAGGLTIATGLGLALGGALVHARRTEVATTRLAPEQQVIVAPQLHACGHLADLRDLVVAAEIDGTGKWLGQADALGVVRIELGESVKLGTKPTVRFSVASAPPSATSFTFAGAPLGALTLGLPGRKLAGR